MAGLRYTAALFVWLAITYSTVNGQFFNRTIDNVVIPLNESSVTVSCPVATMVDSIAWFNATTGEEVATGNDYTISTTGSYYCQATEGRGIYRSNTFTVYRTGFADNFSVHPENFTIFSDTMRVAFECRINTFVATQDDANRLNIVWEGSSSNDTFTMLSGDIFNPLPGYSVLVMDYDDTLHVMFRCLAMFTPLMGPDMVVATSEVAYIVNITDILGLGSASGPPDNRTFLIMPSDELITQMDTAAFVCVPSNTSVEAVWSDNPNSVIGTNNFTLTITNVMDNTSVLCTVGDETANASVTVQEVPALMADTILPPVTAVREGANVTLRCLPIMTYTLYPAPNITWLADGMVAQVSSGNFTIAMVNESNEIVYQCLVEATFVPSTNSIGLPPSVSFITTTVIDCVPDIMVIVGGGTDVDVDGTYDVMSGSSFNITCMLTCPTATLMWIQNDTVISTSPSTMVTIDDFSVQYMNNNDGEITGSVLIRNMSQLNDTATYQCATTVQTIQSNDSAGIFVYAVPEIIQGPVDAARSLGEAVMFTCNATGVPLPIITWSSDSSNAIIPLTDMVTDGGLMRQSQIMLSNLQLGNFENYTCTAMNEFGNDTEMAMLQCIPDVMVMVDGGTDVDVDGIYDVMSGSSFNITCILSCPTATLMWIQNDIVISTGPSTMVTIDDFSVQYMSNSDGEITGSVLIRNMSRLNDTATYQCATTVQTIQSNDTAGIFVYVVPEITQGPVDTARKLGEDVIFTCNATGVPLPNITWSSDSSDVIMDQDDNIMIVDSVDGLTRESQLMIMDLKAADFQNYTCNATNMFGSDNATALLGMEVRILQGPMEMTQLLGGNVTFRCIATGIPLPTITWSSDNDDMIDPSLTKIMEDDNTTILSEILLVNIQMENFVNYNCSAMNQFNTVNASTVLINATIPIITIPPQDAVVLLGGKVTFTCTAIGVPAPNITWSNEVNGTIEATSNITMDTTTTTTSTLVLSNLTASYFNQSYTCTAFNVHNTSSISAILTEGMEPMIIEPPQNALQVVGRNVSFRCVAFGIPRPNITWMLTATDDTMMVLSGNSEVDGGVIRNELNLTNLTVQDFGVYSCIASNMFHDDMEMATLEQGIAALITTLPQDNSTAVSEDITFQCNATGNRAPNITWVRQDGTTFPGSFVRLGNTMTSSSLTITNVMRNDITNYSCVAENIVAYNIIETLTKSDIANFTLYEAVAPYPPMDVMSGSITSRTADITWQDGDLPNPVNPNIMLYRLYLNGTQETVVDAPLRTTTLTGLIPFTTYVVTVVATNRINNSNMSMPHFFTTMEEAPGAPPQDVLGQSTAIGSIQLSWSPPPLDRQYGIITGYYITYQIDGSDEAPNSLPVSTVNTTITRLQSNITYIVRIAAVNGAGTSLNFSLLPIMTIPEPPDLTSIMLPPTGPPPSENIGTTSIILILPSTNVPFSHVWVIAVRLSSSDSDVLRSNTSDYSNRAAFKNYSNALDDEPYIAAEIDASNYPMTFALGDNELTMVYSDFPELDFNGPLMEGRSYNYFVRFFSPRPPVARAKRNINDRQYSVFTTTGFISVISTAITQSDDGNTAVVVGAVIGGLVALIIMIAVVLVVVLFVYRHWDGEVGPPPSRAGSKRFRDEDKPFHAEDALELKAFEPNETRHPIAVQEFENHVRARHKNSDNLFADEYELINIKSPRLSHEATSQAVNIAKNRYANINAYDQTRVRLMPYEGVDGSDYINANYIDGYKKKNAYIATQGPLPNTSEDFWRMVWEQESYTIVMLTNLMEKARVKCHQYWPQVGTVSYGSFTVTLIDSMEIANYCVRTLRLARSDGEKNDETREIKQFHYTSWPDFGVPEHPSPIITFMRRIAQSKPKSAGPVVIHCSAGVGRTGTLITIQSMLEMIIDTGTLDIFNFVLGLRRQRSFMVQTEKQYIFIHDTILEAIKVGNTQIEVMNLRKKLNELGALDPETDQSGIEAEFSKLGDLEQVDTSQFSAATAAYNQNKNRFPHILPYDKHRVKLLMYPGIEGSDYINATFLDGYHQRDQYILTQGPMQNTVGDFWRMIWEYKVSCIAMLCQLQEKGVDQDQSYKYWPELSQVLHFADILIETNAEKTMGGYVMREISITNSKVNESRTVNQFQYLDWQEDRCPNTASSVIDMIGWLTKMQYHRGGGPVVIHDCASVGRSATFCALKIAVEQVKTEGIIDVFYTVHTMRTRQPLSVRQIGQYHFIYNAVAEFLDSFDHYANFNDYKAH